jgi:hypothetical protein
MNRKYKSKRTYYRRYKKKWTPYNSEVQVTAPGATVNSGYYVENAVNCVYGSSNSLGNFAAAQDALSAINYYICRVRFNGVLFTPVAGLSYVIYICYVPNAVTIDNGQQAVQDANLREAYFYKHPEYVLAWTRLDYVNNTGDTGEVRLYSKIKKRLSPGDRMSVVVLARNTSGAAVNISNLQGTFSCYLRTN